MKQCVRCGEKVETISAIGELLFHFTCDYCRLDQSKITKVDEESHNG